jgi:predicted esterase
MGPSRRYATCGVLFVLFFVGGCADEEVPVPRRGTRQSESDVSSAGTSAAATVTPTTAPTTTPTTTSTTPPPPPPDAGNPDDPGPPPVGCGTITRDKDGFFTRTTSKGTYVGYVPKSYAGNPTRLVVGMHGCGDNAYNFATWAVNPYVTRDTQTWIGISVEDKNGPGLCWSQSEDDVVLAALADISKCFYVHQHEVVLAGYSSGGELGYGLAMRHTDKFAGLLAECTTLSSAGDPNTLLAGAAWKLPIAHVAHTGDTTFPIATVRNDWATITAAGFPLTTKEEAGAHDGQSTDWSGWLLPKMGSWKSP